MASVALGNLLSPWCAQGAADKRKKLARAVQSAGGPPVALPPDKCARLGRGRAPKPSVKDAPPVRVRKPAHCSFFSSGAADVCAALGRKQHQSTSPRKVHTPAMTRTASSAHAGFSSRIGCHGGTHGS